MGTHPIFESDFDCLTEITMGLFASSKTWCEWHWFAAFCSPCAHYQLATQTETPFRWARCRFIGLGMWLQILVIMSFGVTMVPLPLKYGLGALGLEEADANQIAEIVAWCTLVFWIPFLIVTGLFFIQLIQLRWKYEEEELGVNLCYPQLLKRFAAHHAQLLKWVHITNRRNLSGT